MRMSLFWPSSCCLDLCVRFGQNEREGAEKKSVNQIVENFLSSEELR